MSTADAIAYSGSIFFMLTQVGFLFFLKEPQQEMKSCSQWLDAECAVDSAQEALKNERSLKEQVEVKLVDEQLGHANLRKECEMLKGKLLESLLEQEQSRKSLRDGAKDEQLSKLRDELIEARTRIKCLEEAEKEKKKVCCLQSSTLFYRTQDGHLHSTIHL